MQPSTTLHPENFEELIKSTGNVYETTLLIAKRAKQIVTRTKEELGDKLAMFMAHEDNSEEIVENQEHIALSQHYEKQPKPVPIAIEEFLTGQLIYRYLDREDTLAEDSKR